MLQIPAALDRAAATAARWLVMAATAVLIASNLYGQASPAESAKPQRERNVAPDRAAAIEELKRAFRSGSGFERAAERARQAAVPQQTIAELQLVSAIRSRSLPNLKQAVADVERMLPQWRAEDSVAFATKEELQGVLLFGRALVSADAGDEAAFEQQMKEAFWADPALAPALADELKTQRRKRQSASLVLPMNTALDTLTGQKTSLEELTRGQKALLLDFWASWCGPCIQSMPELVRRAKALAPQQVRVVGVNTEADESGGFAGAKKQAEAMKKQKKIDFAWLIEPPERPVSKLLKVDSIPHATLVTPEGRILFDGHPADRELLAALQRIGVSLKEE